MTRNTERRIEVACPMLDETIAARIESLMETVFHDNVKARLLLTDGSYQRQTAPEDEKMLNSQLYLYEQACNAAGREFGQV
jgi:polyphosphate kinase